MVFERLQENPAAFLFCSGLEINIYPGESYSNIFRSIIDPMNNTGMLISPGREKGEPELPATGLLLINPAEADAGLRLAQKKGGRQHFLYNSRLALIPAVPPAEPFFLAGPAVGAPMAVLALEKLVALGARRMIVYGWCGSLNETLGIGDVMLPTWAISAEGTSAHYPLKTRPESHASTRQRLIDGLTAQGLTVRAGPVWTTDAPYRESVAQVRQLGKEGVLGVDMEFSALAAAAAFRGIQLTAVLLVSDELWSGAWNPGFRNKGFKKKSTAILHFLADFCSEISAS